MGPHSCDLWMDCLVERDLHWNLELSLTQSAKDLVISNVSDKRTLSTYEHPHLCYKDCSDQGVRNGEKGRGEKGRGEEGRRGEE